MQEGSTPPAKGPQEGQMPPMGSTPSTRTTEGEVRPPPQDGGQGSAAQRPSQGQPRRHAFTIIHRSSNLSASTEKSEQLATAGATEATTTMTSGVPEQVPEQVLEQEAPEQVASEQGLSEPPSEKASPRDQAGRA